MIPAEERPNARDDRAIDRLVAGELSDPDRRELLLQLENDPDGWRRCALAFLEDQAWRSAFGGASSIASETTTDLPTTLRPRLRRFRWASAAAVVLAATFAAGVQTGGPIQSSSKPPLAGHESDGPVGSYTRASSDEIREVGSFNLIEGSAGETPPRRYPIVAGPGLDDQWLQNQPPSVPEYLRAGWERRGYQVAEHRQLVSVPLENGGHVSIPVDEVEVSYVGQQPL